MTHRVQIGKRFLQPASGDLQCTSALDRSSFCEPTGRVYTWSWQWLATSIIPGEQGSHGRPVADQVWFLLPCWGPSAVAPIGGTGDGFPSNTMWPVLSRSIQPFGHNTPTLQTNRTEQWSDSIGWTILQTAAQKSTSWHYLSAYLLPGTWRGTAKLYHLFDLCYGSFDRLPRFDMIHAKRMCSGACLFSLHSVPKISRWRQHMTGLETRTCDSNSQESRSCRCCQLFTCKPVFDDF